MSATLPWAAPWQRQGAKNRLSDGSHDFIDQAHIWFTGKAFYPGEFPRGLDFVRFKTHHAI
jgi:hypothetical protein